MNVRASELVYALCVQEAPVIMARRPPVNRRRIQGYQRHIADRSQRDPGREKKGRRRYDVTRDQEFQYLQFSFGWHRVDCKHSLLQNDHFPRWKTRNALLRSQMQPVTVRADRI